MKADFNLIMTDGALNVVIENSYYKYKCSICTLTSTYISIVNISYAELELVPENMS